MTNAFPNHEGSNSVTFDSLGEFEYSEAKKFKNKFMMRGKITVIKQTHSVNSATPIDTVGVLMVPAEDHNTYFEGSSFKPRKALRVFMTILRHY